LASAAVLERSDSPAKGKHFDGGMCIAGTVRSGADCHPPRTHESL
jgi:hypothetical protein